MSAKVRSANIAPINVTAKEDAIMKCVLAHQTYSPPGSDSDKGIHNQPEFDDVSLCGLSDIEKENFWRLEVRWLLNVAQHPEIPLAFDNDSLGKVRKEGYEKLSNVAELVHWNLTVSRLDNEVTAMAHKFDFGAIDRLKSLKACLECGLDQEQAYLIDPDLKACNALVDFISAILVRITTQSVDSEIQHQRCIASIAKLATKLKLLCSDPKKYAGMTIGRIRDFIAMDEYKRNYRGLPHTNSLDTVLGAPLNPTSNIRRGEFGCGRRQPSEMFERLLSSTGDTRVAVYALEMVVTRRVVSKIASLVLKGMVASNNSGLSSNAFEISSLAYRMAFDSSMAIIGQDRDGQITTTSSSIVIRRTYVAFRELLLSMTPLKQRYKEHSPGPPSDDQDCGSHTVVHWEWEDESDTDTSRGSIHLNDMKDTVTVMGTLLCAQPSIGYLGLQLTLLFRTIVSAKEQIEELPAVDFTALCYIKTNAYENDTAGPLTKDVKPVSRCLMAQHKLFGSNPGIDIPTNKWDMKMLEKGLESDKTELERYRKLSKRIKKDWMIDQKAIVVKCGRYTAQVAAICLTLVLGGLAIGFSLKSRLTGVDPFNLTTFCWVLAGFIILIAKSRRVENWPWRDFFRGRVVCRSISELCSVVGDVEKQDLLVYLLHNELSTNLTTRGPYNRPFLHRDGDGFSIDVELTLRTLFLAGIIVLKVMSDQGPALVCVNLMKQHPWTDVMLHWHRTVEEDDDDDLDLFCIEPSRRVDKQDDAILSFDHLRWSRVLGVYNIPDRKFR